MTDIWFERYYETQQEFLFRTGKLYGFEFKYNKAKTKPPKLWKETYPESEFQCITKDNFLEFLT